MFPLFLALLSAIIGAGTNLLAKNVLSFARTRDMVSVNFVIMALLLAPAAPFAWHFSNDPGIILRIAVAILLDSVANYCYFRSFEELDVLTASSVLAISPLATLLVAPFFDFAGYQVSVFQIGGVAATAGGLYLLTRSSEHRKPLEDTRVDASNGRGNRFLRHFAPRTTLAEIDEKKIGRNARIHIKASILWPIFSTVLFSVSIFVMKDVFSSGATNPYSYYFVRSIGIALVLALVTRPKLAWVSFKRVGITAGRLLFVISQWLLLLYAVDFGNPLVVKSLADTTPFFVAVFTWVGLRERIPSKQLAGALLVLAGAGLLAG